MEEELRKLKETRNIESRSKDTDINNLKQKLALAEKAKEEVEKYSGIESHYRQEMQNLKETLDMCKKDLSETINDRDNYIRKIDELSDELEETKTKLKKLKDNYNALEST